MSVLLAAGCRLSAAPPGSLAQRAGAEIPAAELRIKVRSFIGAYTAAIEQAADEAARRCGREPGVRAHALEWKLGAVPLAQDALLQPDPGAALLDGWAYAMQMESYFERGPGRRELGACHGIAVATARDLQARLRQVVERIVPDKAANAERAVREWAAAHPIEGLMLPRWSTAGELASRSARQDLGALAAVGSVVETLDDLTARIAVYRESLLKEGRWMLELTAADATSGETAARALMELERVSRAVDRLGALAARFPGLVAGEREAALAALREERAAVMADIDRQRVDTLHTLQGAGDAALGRAQEISRTAIDNAADRAERLVDRAFLRGAELVMGLGLLAVVAVLGVAWVLGFRIHAPRRA